MNAFLTANQFSSESVTGMVIVALICTTVPFIFLGYYKSKKKVKISSFFIGMAVYFLFALIGEGLFNIIIFRGFSLSGFLNRVDHPVYYALYGAIVAGVFEETGKYVGLKKWMNSCPGKENAFLFGVGHGSFEAVAYGSSLFMGNIIIAVMVNSFGIDGYFEKLGITGETAAQQREIIHQLMAISPAENAAAGIERILALVFQASLTIFVFLSLNHEKLKYLFPIAVVLHIIGYLPTYLTQVGVLGQPLISLILSGAVVVFTAFYANRMFHTVKESHYHGK